MSGDPVLEGTAVNPPIPTAQHPEVLRLTQELAGEHAERQAAEHALKIEKGVTVELASNLNTAHQRAEKQVENIDILEKRLTVAEAFVKRAHAVLNYAALWVLTHERRKARSYDGKEREKLVILSRELDLAKATGKLGELAGRKAEQEETAKKLAAVLNGEEKGGAK